MSNSSTSYQAPVGNKDHRAASVVIIGAGISGLCTAIDLVRRNRCKNFIIIEKGGGVGGTWRDNIYPGSGCDVWSHLYSFSFEQNPEWTREYPGQEEILRYLVGIAEKYQLYGYIRFNSTVESAEWDEEENKWKIGVSLGGGKDTEYGESYIMTADFLISAVGQLNYPLYPSIKGLEEYKGKLMHSARWDWSYDMHGKRIAIIGNGASAVQIIPEVAKLASELTVFQRSPNWVIPRSDAPISSVRKYILKYFPPIRWRYRADMMENRESLHSAIFDAESKLAGTLRGMTMNLMKSQIPDRPDMWEKLTPNFPPGCKRIIISDDYYPTLNRKNVKLENRPLTSITSSGIRIEDEEIEYDMIILATGFRSLDFMFPMKILGRNNRSIQSIWHNGARALRGISVEDLPNFAMLYGPNTSVAHNSIILMIEAQSRYISKLVNAVLTAKKYGKTLNIVPKQKSIEDFNRKLQRTLNSSSFAHPGCTSWFKTKEGKIINSWSGTVIDYQKEVSRIDWAEYEIRGTGALENTKRSEYVGRVIEEPLVSYWAMILSSVGVMSIFGAIFLLRKRGF